MSAARRCCRNRAPSWEAQCPHRCTGGAAVWPPPRNGRPTSPLPRPKELYAILLPFPSASSRRRPTAAGTVRPARDLRHGARRVAPGDAGCHAKKKKSPGLFVVEVFFADLCRTHGSGEHPGVPGGRKHGSPIPLDQLDERKPATTKRQPAELAGLSAGGRPNPTDRVRARLKNHPPRGPKGRRPSTAARADLAAPAIAPLFLFAAARPGRRVRDLAPPPCRVLSHGRLPTTPRPWPAQPPSPTSRWSTARGPAVASSRLRGPQNVGRGELDSRPTLGGAPRCRAGLPPTSSPTKSAARWRLPDDEVARLPPRATAEPMPTRAPVSSRTAEKSPANPRLGPSGWKSRSTGRSPANVRSISQEITSAPRLQCESVAGDRVRFNDSGVCSAVVSESKTQNLCRRF